MVHSILLLLLLLLLLLFSFLLLVVLLLLLLLLLVLDGSALLNPLPGCRSLRAAAAGLQRNS